MINLLPVITQDITKQLDSEKFDYINKTSLLYNNIKFTTDSLKTNGMVGYSVLYACSDEYSISKLPGFMSAIFKDDNPYPHYLQIEFDEVINGVNKFCFNPGAYCLSGTFNPATDECYVKDYNLYYSLDGNEWIKICSKTFLPKTCIYSEWSFFKQKWLNLMKLVLNFLNLKLLVEIMVQVFVQWN